MRARRPAAACAGCGSTWTTGLAVALVVLPFAAGPAIGCAVGTALASRRRAGRSRARRSDRDRRGLPSAAGRDPARTHEREPHADRRRDRLGQDGHRGADRRPRDRARPRRRDRRPEGRSAVARAARARPPGAPDARSSSGRPAARAPTTPTATAAPGEIADKALAGERYSEPHYLRQAQRYLAHAVRALDAVGRARDAGAAAGADGSAAPGAARTQRPGRGGRPAAVRLPRRARRAPAQRSEWHPRSARDPRRVRARAVASSGGRGAGARPARGGARAAPSSTSASRPTGCRCSRGCLRPRSWGTC